jgi:hypothetical protein
MPLHVLFTDTTSALFTDYVKKVTYKIYVMSKAKEGKERKNNKKEAVKSLKEKRTFKAAKKAEKSGTGQFSLM